MAIHYRTQGFVLKKIDRGETDQLFTIYTQDFGKLEILGRAIRKTKSKLRSGTELFYLSDIEFIQGKTYKTLTDAILIENFFKIRRDLKKLAAAFKTSEVLDDLVKGQESDEKAWQLLNEAFERLNDYDLKLETPSLIYYYFLWNLLSVLGYELELYGCSLCRKKLTPSTLYFNPEGGGVVCGQCSGRAKTKSITPEILKILRLLLKKDWKTLSRLKKIEQSYQKELKNISEAYLSYVLGSPR